MKRIFNYATMFAIALASVGAFSSCSKDDDNGGGVNPITDNTNLWYAYNPSTSKYGFVNEKGEMVIAAQYDNAENFSCGMALVDMGGKEYFIDTNGSMVTGKAEYDAARDFQNNFARVIKDGSYGLINKNMEYAIYPAYYKLGDVADNGLLYAKVSSSSSSKYGYMDTSGNFKIEPQFDSADDFIDGIAVVKSGSKYGAIDASGKWVIQPSYDKLESVYNDRLEFRKDNLYGLIDKTGKVIVPELYSSISEDEFKSGLYRVCDKNGKYGFIDRDGNVKIGFAYDSATNFAGDFAIVKNEDVVKVINRSNVVVQTLPKNTSLVDYHNGMYLLYTWEQTNTSTNPNYPTYSYTYTYKWVNKDLVTLHTWTTNK